jgi:hypothetical protein
MMTAARWVACLIPAIVAFVKAEEWIVDNVWEDKIWTLLISLGVAAGTWVVANAVLIDYIN